MNHPRSGRRDLARTVVAHGPAYAAFAMSFAFTAAVVFGLLG